MIYSTVSKIIALQLYSLMQCWVWGARGGKNWRLILALRVRL